MNSRKKKYRRSKKKKEDLDGSKLYRDRDGKEGRISNADSNQQSSQGKKGSRESPPQPKKKRVSPIKQKQSLGAVVNQKGRLLDSKLEKKKNGRSNSRGGQSISSGGASAQLEGGECTYDDGMDVIDAMGFVHDESYQKGKTNSNRGRSPNRSEKSDK